MPHAAFTLRLPSEERIALEDLSRIEGRPMNQLLNDAVRDYLHRQGTRERSLGESLDRLRKYRQRDPDFRESIAAFADAEATLQDPLEGTVIRAGHGAQDSVPVAQAPLQTSTLDSLHG